MSDRKTMDAPPIEQEVTRIIAELKSTKPVKSTEIISVIARLWNAVQFATSTPTEPSITLRELKALVEGMKRKLPTGNEIELGIADNSTYTHNTALTDLYEAAEKGRK